jgi:mRNA-degrading endonuclease RelE of RelBE toxin-antitoxin system
MVRKARLRTFKYNVIYVIDDTEVVIVAVAHYRRRPGYWHSRLATLR